MTKRFSLFPWRSRTEIARDVDAELAFHLEMRVNELVAGGLTPDEARRRAQDEFGDLEFCPRGVPAARSMNVPIVRRAPPTGWVSGDRTCAMPGAHCGGARDSPWCR